MCSAIHENYTKGRRSVGHPAARWADEIVAIVGRYLDEAGARKWDWDKNREAYAQQTAVGEIGLWMLMIIQMNNVVLESYGEV